jgi:hypothetical protein
MYQHALDAAVTFARQGQRPRAYRLLRHVLRRHPTSVAAWLWLSAVVTDPVQQRDCLERALALDPQCRAAQVGLACLRHDVALSQPATAALPQPIGAYLVAYAGLSEEQCAEALRAQRAADGPVAPPLGQIVMERGWVRPSVLATMLLMQLADRMLGQGARPPARLGEYLVAEGLLRVEQLAPALTEQLEAQQQGRAIPLGALLVRQGMLQPAQLAAVLERQWAARAYAGLSRKARMAAFTASGSSTVEVCPPPGIITSCECEMRS